MIKYSDISESSGIETFDNGDIYEGGFKDGLKHGKGTLTTRNNRSYAVSYTHLTLPTIYSV